MFNVPVVGCNKPNNSRARVVFPP
ncbi:hypothetical protein CP8484711_0413A, partial [Chlamydia psittaci 84-8471/1]